MPSVHGRRGYDGTIDASVELGVSREDASYVHACFGYNGILNTIVEAGVLREDAPSVFIHCGYDGMIKKMQQKIDTVETKRLVHFENT